MNSPAISLELNNTGTQLRFLQWRMLLITMLCYLFFYTGRQNYSFAILGIQEELNLTASHTGIISGMLLLFYGGGQILSGYLGDRYSPKLIISMGALASILLNHFVSFSTGLWSFLILWCANGLAQSMGFAPGSKLITNWWPKEERSFAMGCFLFSSGLSSVVTFGLCLFVIQNYSWPWVFRLPLIPFLCVTIIFYLFISDRPQEYGYQVASENTNKENSSSKQNSILMIISNKKFVLASLAMGFCSIARYGLIIWVPVYYLKAASDHNVWITLALPFGMAIGSIVAGYLTDKYFAENKNHVISIFMIMAAGLIVVFLKVPNELVTLNILILFVCGFFVYGAQTPLFSICHDLIDKHNLSTAMGLMNATGYAFAGMGEFIIGYMIYKNNNNFKLMFIVVLISCVLSALMAIGANNDTKCK